MRPATLLEERMQIDRRGFLRVSAGAAGGLLVSLYIDLPAFAQEGNQAQPPQVYPPDAFVHITPDGKILITVSSMVPGTGRPVTLSWRRTRPANPCRTKFVSRIRLSFGSSARRFVVLIADRSVTDRRSLDLTSIFPE